MASFRLARLAPAIALLALESGARAAPAPVGPEGEPNAAQRRAVRGATAADGAVESAELRELRQFEDQAFPRHVGLPIRVTEPAATGLASQMPPSLRGRWSGSGDVPEVLRSRPVDRGSAAAKDGVPPPDGFASLTLPDLPVRWDPAVIRFIEFFTVEPRGRAIMTSWLRKMGRYKAVIERTLQREGLPRDLIYLAMVESGFEPGAVSNVGAGGVWQFMRDAGRAYGLESSYWVDARRDPERAALGAARYLKDLNVRFGSWPLAFAAYNAGYGAILKSIERYNTNDFWALCRHEAGLPWETTLYVPKILAAAVVGHNLARFGFGNLVMDPPLSYEEVVVPPGTTLAAVARSSGATVETIEGLNPELVRGRTPPDRGPQPVRVPIGAAQDFTTAFAKRGGGEQVATVVLRFGEALADVAQRYGITERELRRLNQVRNTQELRGGTTIVVPVRAGSAAAQVGGVGEAGNPEAEPERLLVAVPDREFEYPDRDRVFYKTRSGDTLAEIAGVFEVSLEDLVSWNNVDAEARLQGDMVLQLFVQKEFDRAGAALLDPEQIQVVTLGSDQFLELQAAVRGRKRLVYTAKAGDTLAKLARRYGVRPADLARINQFSFKTEIAEGKRIVVYTPQDTPDPVRRDAGPARGKGAGAPTGAAVKTNTASNQPTFSAKTTPPSRKVAQVEPAVKLPLASKGAPAGPQRKTPPAGGKTGTR